MEDSPQLSLNPSRPEGTSPRKYRQAHPIRKLAQRKKEKYPKAAHNKASYKCPQKEI
jgi:hypothetical protein